MKCLHGDFESAEECPKCIEAKRLLETVEASRNAIPEVAELNEIDNIKTEDEIDLSVISIAPDQDSVVLKLYEESKSMLIHAQSRIISTIADLIPATEDLSLIANYKDAIEEQRKAYTTPIRAKLDAINAAFKDFVAPLTEADTLTRNKVLTFKQEQTHLRQEAERLEAEKLRLAQDEMRLKGEHTMDLTEIEKPDLPSKTTRTQVGDASTMDVWKYEVVDFALLPDEYKVPDTTTINAKVRKHHDDVQIPGVRIYCEQTLRVNARRTEQ